MMNTNTEQPQQISPQEVAMMQTLANEAASGGYEQFLAMETEWQQTALSGFMNSRRSAPAPQPAPPPAKPLDPVPIYAKWNSAGQNRPVLAASDTQPSNADEPFDPVAIYAQWNSLKA